MIISYLMLHGEELPILTIVLSHTLKIWKHIVVEDREYLEFIEDQQITFLPLMFYRLNLIRLIQGLLLTSQSQKQVGWVLESVENSLALVLKISSLLSQVLRL